MVAHRVLFLKENGTDGKILKRLLIFAFRFVALKKLNRASEVDIAKLVNLEHSNIVKTIGICSRDIYPCIVMEYCEKGSLFDLLSKEQVGKHKFLRWFVPN